MYLLTFALSMKNKRMKDLQRELKAAIKQKYGTIEKWADAHDILSSRFYNFLKGDYNPTVKTLAVWLNSVDLELSARKKR